MPQAISVGLYFEIYGYSGRQYINLILLNQFITHLFILQKTTMVRYRITNEIVKLKCETYLIKSWWWFQSSLNIVCGAVPSETSEIIGDSKLMKLQNWNVKVI